MNWILVILFTIPALIMILAAFIETSKKVCPNCNIEMKKEWKKDWIKGDNLIHICKNCGHTITTNIRLGGDDD